MAVNNAYGVMPRPKKSEHYVNNKDFLNALELYFAQVARAKLNDQPKPPIPRYIGECFLKIANHLSYKPNFVNYMFKDDMICDGIENCVRYVHNFNPEKSNSIEAAVTLLLESHKLRNSFARKAQAEAMNYSWKVTATETLKVIVSSFVEKKENN